MTEIWRITYAIAAVLVSIGFTASLRLRWENLERGERVIRVGLIVEHVALFYGAYYALKHHLASSAALPVVALSMLVMVVGFADWILDDLLPEYLAARRSHH